MHFGVDAWIPDLFERMTSVLVAAQVLQADYIFSYLGEADDLLMDPPAEQFICIAPIQMPVDQPGVAGGGAAWTSFNSRWRLDVFANVGEREKRTGKTLSAASKSMATLVKATVKALQVHPANFSATNTTADLRSPLKQPMRLIGLTFNPRKPKTGWAWCRTEWQVYHRTDFSR